MFQAIKRAKFLSQHNYSHWDTGDIVSMHLWLQEHGWPANEFVDLYMRGHRASPPGFEEHDAQTFTFYMEDQYEFVRNDNVESLNHLFETISRPEFMAADKDGLVNWLERFVKAVYSRQSGAVDGGALPKQKQASEVGMISCPNCERKTVNHGDGSPIICPWCNYKFTQTVTAKHRITNTSEHITQTDSTVEMVPSVKKWLYDSKTKILKNNASGVAYPPNRYEHQATSNVSGFQILHGPDVWVNDWDVDMQ